MRNITMMFIIIFYFLRSVLYFLFKAGNYFFFEDLMIVEEDPNLHEYKGWNCSK